VQLKERIEDLWGELFVELSRSVPSLQAFSAKDKGEGVPLEKNTLANHQKGDITQKKFNN
jgi:hypothetical protein